MYYSKAIIVILQYFTCCLDTSLLGLFQFLQGLEILICFSYVGIIIFQLSNLVPMFQDFFICRRRLGNKGKQF